MYELAKKRPVTTLQPRRVWKYGKIGKKKTLKENFLELFIYLRRTFRDFNAEVMSPVKLKVTKWPVPRPRITENEMPVIYPQKSPFQSSVKL